VRDEVLSQSIKRFGQFVQTVLGIIFRHPVTGASVVPILPNGEIVLVRRQDNGKWALPGGMVDWGETIPTTIGRELAEETGLELIKIRRLVGVYSEPDRDPRLHSICILVEADVQGTLQPQDTLEIREVRAFSADALPMEDLSYDYQRQIQDYLAGRTTLT
jgi:ADP-ribose pyrophosphatase YjhB (NUDIX family)